MGIVPTSDIESIDCGYHTHRELYAKNRKKGGQNDRPGMGLVVFLFVLRSASQAETTS